MEVMEDGNLIDKVNILIQRDFAYYKTNQCVLQETICPNITGGKLDFPRYASFAAVKLVLWWEDEFLAGFRKDSGLVIKVVKIVQSNASSPDHNQPIVKASDPYTFITAVASSAKQLLEHLHVLTQEALDHSDLTVLMGTIGAAALVRNCLWYYIQSCTENSKQHSVESLQTNYKQYQEMGEALAERLLDLHCRLVSLYILQDAESLDWENSKPFFESERGSYVIQMWWLYINGTKYTLWNTVPPKMAQSVFAGLLNESLTILAVRYTQSCPSENRSKLLTVDISNLLMCVGQLLPSICNSVDEVIGLNLNSQSKIIRDIHAKCQELFACLFLRGTPLDVLYKVCKKGLDSMEAVRSRAAGLSPWVVFGLPHLFGSYPKGITKSNDLPENAAIAMELFVMLSQPQPNWSLLLKVLGMRNGKVMQMLFTLSVKLISNTSHKVKKAAKSTPCDGFLCMKDNSCQTIAPRSSICTDKEYNALVESLTFILLFLGNNKDFTDIFLPCITGNKDWAQCFDRRQVWCANYPPWYKAIMNLVKPILQIIAPSVTSAVQTGASMYQAMKIIFASLTQLWDCLDLSVTHICLLLQEALPTQITPIGNSTLLQILVSGLYEEFVNASEDSKKEVRFSESNLSINVPLKRQVTLDQTSSTCSFDGVNNSVEGVSLAIAEALCSIDEDNKHTEEIENFLEQAKLNLEMDNVQTEGCKRVEHSLQMCEVLVSELLMTPDGKKSLKIVYNFLNCNSDWLLQELGTTPKNDAVKPNKAKPVADNLLHTMFYIGSRPFDELLTEDWKPDWASFYHIPMGLSGDRIWNQVSKRWEFRDVNSSNLSAHDARIISHLTNLFKQT